MGITVDPTWTAPPPPAEMVSPDGLLTAKAHPDGSGIYLIADFTSLGEPYPSTVRFFRSGGTLVRSGDPAQAPGGIAVAFDHEAPIGTPATYYAVPIMADGTVGTRTEAVALLLPIPDTERDLWIKSVDDPALSLLSWPSEPPEIVYPVENTYEYSPGARLPFTSLGRRQGVETTLSILTQTLAESQKMMALLDAGVWLLQTNPEYDFPPIYVLPDEVTKTRLRKMFRPLSKWTIPVHEVPRPATADAPLRIPGNSYAATDPDFPSYGDAVLTGTTYLEEMT